jgi:RNA polymerase sigma factor (sigma-70 family)
MFLSFHDEYVSLHDQLLAEQTKWINTDVNNSSTLKDVSDKMEKIEYYLCTNRTYLIGLIKWIKERWAEYTVIRNTIVESYLRIVYSLASDFSVDEYTLTDHYQVGTLGLLRCVSNYNPMKGSFSGYAKLWIRQSILSSIKDMNIIKIPASTWQCFTILERKRSLLRINSLKKLSILAGVSEDRISDVYDKVRTSQVCRLDEPVDDDESTTEHYYEEIIEAANYVTPVEPEDDPLLQFDYIKSDLGRRLMILCHGDIQDIVKLSQSLPSAREIAIERIRQRAIVL